MTILALLVVFVLGVLVGACSWLVAAAWFEAKRDDYHNRNRPHPPTTDLSYPSTDRKSAVNGS